MSNKNYNIWSSRIHKKVNRYINTVYYSFFVGFVEFLLNFLYFIKSDDLSVNGHEASIKLCKLNDYKIRSLKYDQINYLFAWSFIFNTTSWRGGVNF